MNFVYSFIQFFHELQNHQNFCLHLEPCTMKIPRETSFKLRNYYCEIPLSFVEVADFEAMNKKKTRKEILTEINYQKVSFDVSFYMTNKLGYPS